MKQKTSRKSVKPSSTQIMKARAERIAFLENELGNAQETLRAIQNGEVDALVVKLGDQERIFTLKSADLPYRILVETMSEGAATISADGTIIYCNRRFGEMLGLPNEKIIGRPLISFIAENNLPRFRNAFYKASLSRAKCTIHLRTSQPPERPTLLSMSMVQLEVGPGVCLVATDLTEQRQYEKARAEVEKLNVERELRERFVSTLSHDLRSPLTAVKAGAQMIIRFPDQLEKHQIFGNRIINAIDRADKMIQNLLDANRIRAGEKLPLEISECDLKQTIRETLSDLAMTVGDRFELQADLAVHGFWSSEQLRRVVENLAINAIKYGAQDTLVIVSISSDNEYAFLKVHNQGNPIPIAEQATLFDAYSRSVTALGSGKLGWGLGLTLVRGVAEAHGGTVYVESRPVVGTTFTVKLPKDSRPYQKMDSRVQ